MTAPPLAIDHRRLLERAVNRARVVAESGADAALIALSFDEYVPPSPRARPDPSLVGQLRDRSGQLGEGDAVQGRRALVEEIAYERWHRMLFARFLAENGLLREPESGATVTLDDCEEIANERNDGSDRWSVAIGYAVGLLPGIFKPNIPATRVVLAREYRSELEALVVGMPDDVFTSADGLGWVYQFWQARRKKEINDRVRSTGEKITGADIPPVTQLFTDDYIVRFLLENTLGAWWAGKHPDSPLLDDMPYLRWADETAGDGSPDTSAPSSPAMNGLAEPQRSALTPTNPAQGERGAPSFSQAIHGREGQAGLRITAPGHHARHGMHTRRAAAGTFAGWAETAAELKILDPCCGSGHFLVAAFGMLHRMRLEEDPSLTPATAADAVLRDNLSGLELDRRCTQVAMFNLSMAAWKVGGHPERPEHWPQVAWSGTPIRADAAEWEGLTRGRDAWEAEFLRDVYRVFVDAPTLGSLIDLNALINANPYRMLPRNNRRLQVLLDRILKQVVAADDRPLFAIAAGEVAHAYDILDQRYDLTITNVPYLSRGSHDPALRAFADRWHPTSKNDLATMMLARCIRFGTEGGTVVAVTPQNWLFLGSYKKMRQDLLVSTSLNIVARLGPGAFETVGGDVVNVGLIGISSNNPQATSTFAGLDVSTERDTLSKAKSLRHGEVSLLDQADQLKNPDQRILARTSNESLALLSSIAASVEGLSTGDRDRYVIQFWEVGQRSDEWSRFQTSPERVDKVSGCSEYLRWDQGGELLDSPGARIQGHRAWGKPGTLIGRIQSIRSGPYFGGYFDKSAVVLSPTINNVLAAITCYCNDERYATAVRSIDQKIGIATASMGQVPFDLEYWQKVASETYPNGLPEPHSDDPTQWLFRGQPRGSEQPLQVALARLLGYRWPEQDGPTPQPPPHLTPAGVDGEGEHRSVATASPSPPQRGGAGEGSFFDPLDELTDPDGIVCLPPVAGEQPAAERLRALLAAAWGDGWSGETLDGLLAAAGSPGRDLEGWLREDAFKQHVRLFHNRPFLWHIWDGRKDGFSAFVNYHGLDRSRLDKLTYTYLGDWIRRQREETEADIAGAPARLAAALDLQRRLELIRVGEAPHDVYVRWKPLDEQPIGWEPDLNDGVRLNIRPFVQADVLRARFNVKWGKDRGANPPGSDVFRCSETAQEAAVLNRPAEINGKARLNDLHLSLATKRAAREQG